MFFVLIRFVKLKTILEVESSGGSAPSTSAWKKIQTFFNVDNHIMIFTVAIYMSFLCYGVGNLPISWHAWLCCLGYQLLMTEAILAFYSQNVWSQKHHRNVKKTLHWVLQTVGSLAAIAGMIIEFLNKSQHFKSTHSILGLTAGILTVIGMLNGVTALWAMNFKRYVRPVYMKMAHNLNGIAAFVLGMTALYFGDEKKFLIKNSRADIQMCLQALTIITIILSLIGAVRTLINQLRVVFQ